MKRHFLIQAKTQMILFQFQPKGMAITVINMADYYDMAGAQLKAKQTKPLPLKSIWTYFAKS